MSSNDIDDEKPNLRPTKFLDASGKSLGKCSCFRQSWGDSCIYATWNHPTNNRKRTPLNKPGLFGIEDPFVEYSLNKQQRWELFDRLRQNIAHSSDSSSEDEYRHDEQDVNHVKIFSSRSERCTAFPRRSLSKKWIIRTTNPNRPAEDYHASVENMDQTTERAAGITYIAIITSRKKSIPSIRTNHGKNDKKFSSHPPNQKFNLMKEQTDADAEDHSSDYDGSTDSPSTCAKRSSLQLNDFLSVRTDRSSSGQSDNSKRTTTVKFDPKSAPKYWDQMSVDDHRERKTYLQQHPKHDHHVQSKTKPSYHLMSLSFRSVNLNASELTREYLSKTYGKNFIDAQCHPTKYLVCLTDRLKSSLDCYLILVLNEETKMEAKICRAQVGLNIDLYAETLEWNSLSTSEKTIYGIEELIERGIDFLTALPFETFKPIESEMSRRKLARDRTDHQLSDGEFLNKHIQQVHSLKSNDLQTQLTMKEEESNDSICTRPKICTNCCQDMNDFTPMTALKTCGHWLCNDCWKQYLEYSIKHVKMLVCLEWNCTSVVDAGTILSLVNIRCLNTYERHIENCLVNLSRSYVRCPLTSCTNIVQIIGSSALDYVQCRCGHQFCYDCKEESHFPATCRSYRAYIEIAKRNGHLNSDFNLKTIVTGRKCISCHTFFEKNGGCNHMRCRCGAEFCWLCGGYWKEHQLSPGIWKCPEGSADVEKRVLIEDYSPSKQLYASAIYHRYQRTFQIRAKLKENVRRLVGTVPIDEGALLDSTLIKIQLEKREALLEHCYQMVKYIDYLHRVCEFVAVAGGGYSNHPKEFSNIFYPIESVLSNLIQIVEVERGYSAIEQLHQMYQRSEKLIERLRRVV